MSQGFDATSDDVDTLRGVALSLHAEVAEQKALIAYQKLVIAKMQRQLYGAKAERSARLIDQMELEFEELEAAATEDELAAEQAVARTTRVAGFERKAPRSRTTFPDHLPRERIVIDPPTACDCCGGSRLRKLGEDVTQTLEIIPRQWKVIQTVREKFSCRDCEKISQPPAPFHAIQVTGALFHTQGGLDIDARCRVLDVTGPALMPFSFSSAYNSASFSFLS